MSTPMGFDYAGFRQGAGELKQSGDSAASAANDAANGYTSQTGDSPAGQRISILTAALHGGIAQMPPGLTNGAGSLDGATGSSLDGVSSADQQNAARYTGDPSASAQNALGGSGDSSQAGGDPLSAALGGVPGGPGDLDPKSIDQEAKDKAQQMLSGDQGMQQFMQMAQMGAQMGQQIAQQVSQQVNQMGQQLGQVVQQAGQQVGQMLSKAVESGVHAPDISGAELSGLGAGGGDLGGLGGGGGGGGGSTIPAGLEGPVTPMTTSSALQQSPLPAAGGPGSGPGGAPQRGMPMMPMMPMHPRAQDDKGSGGKTRNPLVFPDRPVYEGPPAVEQNFGANPEIAATEPPFGDAPEAERGH